jgi:hypothetical protein
MPEYKANAYDLTVQLTFCSAALVYIRHVHVEMCADGGLP